jgi:hypothetical protein
LRTEGRLTKHRFSTKRLVHDCHVYIVIFLRWLQKVVLLSLLDAKLFFE